MRLHSILIQSLSLSQLPYNTLHTVQMQLLRYTCFSILQNLYTCCSPVFMDPFAGHRLERFFLRTLQTSMGCGTSVSIDRGSPRWSAPGRLFVMKSSASDDSSETASACEAGWRVCAVRSAEVVRWWKRVVTNRAQVCQDTLLLVLGLNPQNRLR